MDLFNCLSMNSKLYTALLLIFCAVGLYFTIELGQHNQFEEKLPLTYFENSQQIIDQIEPILKSVFDTNQILFLGVMADSPKHVELWQNLLKKMSPTIEIIYDTAISPADAPNVMDTLNEYNRFAQGLKTLKNSNRKVAVIMPTVYASQILDFSVATRLKYDFQMDILSVIISSFPNKREDEINFKLPCATIQEKDLTGTGELGCVILQRARSTYRKYNGTAQMYGLMDLNPPKDYFFLLNM